MTRRAVRPNKKYECLESIGQFPLLSAILGRRSRRFSQGAEIPSGPFAFKSKRPIQPLDDFEKHLIVSMLAGPTGWNHLIPFNQKYSPRMPNYAGSAGGRSFPSAAGFHTTDLFFTDDEGTYFLSTKDMPPIESMEMAAEIDLDQWIENTKKHIKKLSDKRLEIPHKEPHMESHNLWVSNNPGSLFLVPVADLSHHAILGLCYILQNGYGIADDINKRSIPGLEAYKHIVDLDNLYPLSYFDQLCYGEAMVELSTSCYSGALLLQAMGLGGWMYDGVNPLSVMGVTGDPENKGFGFDSVMKEGWNFPNPLGIPNVFETKTPPYYPDMRAAVRSVAERKFGEGGPFNSSTHGPWKISVRNHAEIHAEEFIDCVTLMAQYIYDTFGKFPATVPTSLCFMYLQAFHLDTDFYDTFYKPGSYLETHEHHHNIWH